MERAFNSKKMCDIFSFFYFKACFFEKKNKTDQYMTSKTK